MRILMAAILFTLASCSSTYVKVDKVNYDRFEHDQKVVIGMSKKEVLKKFGSPDMASSKNYGTQWKYYHKIFCAHDGAVCAFYFDDGGKLIDTFNVRMEFNDTVASK
jgi:outer membrane protein assembly factor BamE (lipoprotein component of BamABCDE complex)